MAFAAALVTAMAMISLASKADVLRVAIDKTEILRLDKPATIVMVGTPEIADVTVESPRLIFLVGKKAGETNLLILDSRGEKIQEFIVVVVPEAERHVTIHRSSDSVSTLSCEPTCVGVKNPGLDSSETKSSRKSDAPASGKPGAAAGEGATGAAPAEGQAKGAPSAPAKSSMPSASYK